MRVPAIRSPNRLAKTEWLTFAALPDRLALEYFVGQSGEARMTGKQAEQTLGVIRTLMERSQLYSNLSGQAGITAGLLTLVGAVLRARFGAPFLATWFGVLIAACAGAVYFTAAMARENEEPLWTRQARTVVLALTPALVAALVLTFVLTKIGQQALLPGVWMLLWGAGALSMSFFTPRVLSLLGSSFMGCGALALIFGPFNDALSMGATFGLLHVVYGIGLYLRRRRPRAAPVAGVVEPVMPS